MKVHGLFQRGLSLTKSQAEGKTSSLANGKTSSNWLLVVTGGIGLICCPKRGIFLRVPFFFVTQAHFFSDSRPELADTKKPCPGVVE